MFKKQFLKFNAIKLFLSTFIVILLFWTVRCFITIILYYNVTPFPTGSHYNKYCIEKIPIVLVTNRLRDVSVNFRFGVTWAQKSVFHKMVVWMYMCLHVTEEIKLIHIHQIRNKDINEGTSVTYIKCPISIFENLWKSVFLNGFNDFY